MSFETTSTARIRAEDGPDAIRAQLAGAETLVALHGLTRVLTLYEPNNSAVIRLVGTLTDTILKFFTDGGDVLKLQLLEDECFVNGKLLRVEATLYDRAQDLTSILGRFEIGEIEFRQGTNAAAVEAFVADFATSLKTGVRALPEGGYDLIALGRSAGRSIASFRFEPDRLAIWLYAGLLDVVERLYSEYGEGNTPSLLPVRRLLQLLIDSARSLGGIYQVLATMKDPSVALTLPRLRTAMAVDSVGFGIFMGLRNTELMTLALSALLGGLNRTGDPDQAVEPLFSYPGLGGSAMVLILAVHDTKTALRGSPAGVPGRMLAAVECFHRYSANPKAPQAPTAVLVQMAGDEIEGCDVGMGKLFAAYKGKYPLGCTLKLSDGRVGVVLSQGDSQATKARPTVGIVEGTKLTDRVDLSTHMNLQVVATPSAAGAGMDLTRLTSSAAPA
ncbi:MAG: hypothetical protein GY898_20485 [Proteobacteria bacterium]|nr:hypothetical protein [Pseudomonadota bacterium]